MDENRMTRIAAAGLLTEDTIIPLDGRPRPPQPGGAIYAAVGMAIWSESVGLISRIGEGYPQEWLEEFSRRGMDVRAIHRISEPIDQRAFYAYTDGDKCERGNPLAHFSRVGVEIPKGLIGYEPLPFSLDSKRQVGAGTLRPQEFPADWMDATAVHLCPVDFLTHILLPPILKENNVATITVDPAEGYMDPAFWDDMPALLRTFNAFLCSEKKIRRLFSGRSGDLWEMAETLAGFGCPIVIIKRGSQGQYLYVHDRHERFIIPAYPVSTILDPTGCGDAFCGGFLANYVTTYEPLEAALHGNISASLVIEGSGPFFALDSMPGLAESRLLFLREHVRKA